MLRLPSFTYRQPKTLKEALAMKADAGPDGMYVAGGTDLYPNMKRRHQTPATVISLMGIPELTAPVRRTGGQGDGGFVLGSCVTLTDLSTSPPVRLRRRPRRRARVHAPAPQHGHPRREPLPRHALQLLRPDLRVAEGDRFLHEEGRAHLLGGSVLAPL